MPECEWCGRSTPREQLLSTPDGGVCPRCVRAQEAERARATEPGLRTPKLRDVIEAIQESCMTAVVSSPEYPGLAAARRDALDARFAGWNMPALQRDLHAAGIDPEVTEQIAELVWTCRFQAREVARASEQIRVGRAAMALADSWAQRRRSS